MSEWSVADVMPQGDSFDEVFVKSQETADIACDFGKKLDMQNSVGDVVVINQVEDLGFVYVAGIRQRVNDPVRIKREILSVPALYSLLRLPPYGSCT